MKKNKYMLIKKMKYIKYSDLVIDCSYNMQKKKDKESIGTIKFYNDYLIQCVIKKTLDSRFKKLLSLILEEDDNPEGLILCLDEIDKFKKEINNKYEKYLEKKKKDLLKKKLDILEEDVKKKLITFKLSKMTLVPDYEEEEELTRHRHR